MENNTKKGLIAAGIIALLVWFSKKGKPTETPTEEPIGGGGGIGGGGFTPSGLIVNTTTTTTPTPPTKATTPTNLSPTLKDALGKTSMDNVQVNIPNINPTTGLPIGSTGGAVVQMGGTLPKTAYTPTSGGTLGGGSTNPKPFYKPTTGGTPIYNTGINPNLPKTTYIPTSGGTALGGGITSGGVKSGGVSSSLKNALGSQSGLNVFVGFDGKIIRPSHKVDFF
tara:strand:- start:7258 stop:7929 length:672 start_codon:yes stop_codon:yes gene_type:complete